MSSPLHFSRLCFPLSGSAIPLLLLAVLACAGCGGSAASYTGEKRIPLSGKVTLDGQPVTAGSIVFVPMDEKVRPSGGLITDGTYSVPEEKGANAGQYQIQIHWLKPTGKQVKNTDTGEMIDEVKEAIPKKYNEATQTTVKVTSSEHTFDFDLTSK